MIYINLGYKLNFLFAMTTALDAYRPEKKKKNVTYVT